MAHDRRCETSRGKRCRCGHLDRNGCGGRYHGIAGDAHEQSSEQGRFSDEHAPGVLAHAPDPQGAPEGAPDLAARP